MLLYENDWSKVGIAHRIVSHFRVILSVTKNLIQNGERIKCLTYKELRPVDSCGRKMREVKAHSPAGSIPEETTVVLYL